MLKKTITYTNLFTEKEETEDHWFHISKAELVEMNVVDHKERYVNKDGVTMEGMGARIQRIVDSEDGQALMDLLKDMIRRSYGRRVADSFRKSPQIWDEFSGSEAYSQLLLELSLDVDAAAEFMNSVFPTNAELEKMAQEIAAKHGGESPAIAAVERVADATGTEFPKEDPTGLTNPVTPQVLTRVQALDMDSNELQRGIAEGRYRLEA